jgi:hypothetical protein
MSHDDSTAQLDDLVRDFVASLDIAALILREFVGARFDAGLAWIHHPVGLGGPALPRTLRPALDARLAGAVIPSPPRLQHDRPVDGRAGER